MIDIIDIDDLFPERIFYKFNNPKFGYSLNLGDFVRYYFNHNLVKKPDYVNDTYLFIPICDPDKILTSQVDTIAHRVKDSEKLNIVISYPMEMFLTDQVGYMVKYFASMYKKANFFFSFGNALDCTNYIRTKLIDNINYIPHPLFELLYSEHIQNNGTRLTEKTKLSKKFLLPIRNAKPFRMFLYLWARDNNILDNSYYSWTTENVYHSASMPATTTLWNIDFEENKEFLTTSVSLDPEDLREYTLKQWFLRPNLVESSFMQIVCETSFVESLEKKNPTIFLTEKTYKPIFYKQPFILVSEPFSLRYLRSMGYKTFSSFIDESYDFIIDPQQRMKHITNEILKINNMSLEQLEDIRVQIQDIVEHNYNVFMSRPSEKILVKHIEETLLYGKQRSIKLIGE